MTSPRHKKLLADLAELKLHRIAELYQEVLNEAARQGSSMLDVLAALVGEEVAVRRQGALQRRLRRARLPKRKTLGEYDFSFPKRIPKQAVLRLFDCHFVAQHGCAVFIGPTGTGKPQPTQYPSRHPGMRRLRHRHRPNPSFIRQESQACWHC
jgi:DNA replication protein DnaC